MLLLLLFTPPPYYAGGGKESCSDWCPAKSLETAAVADISIYCYNIVLLAAVFVRSAVLGAHRYKPIERAITVTSGFSNGPSASS